MNHCPSCGEVSDFLYQDLINDGALVYCGRFGCKPTFFKTVESEGLIV